MRNNKYILLLITVLTTALLSSCREELPTGGEGEESYAGEKILFTTGATENSVTRAGANSYYMADNSRFVCRMYYMAHTGTDVYDVTGGTDITAWLSVQGSVGNSLYRTRTYTAIADTAADSHGNDEKATCFYWQNRKKHAFLAWTDLNHATTMTGDPQAEGTILKFTPADYDYIWHSGTEEEQWVLERYEVHSNAEEPLEFNTWEELRTYIESDNNYAQHIRDQIPAGINPAGFSQYYYEYGWSCKYSEQQSQEDMLGANYRKVGWIQYQMFYDKLTYSGEMPGPENWIVIRTIDYGGGNIEHYLYNTQTGDYLAEVVYEIDELTGDTTDTHYYTTDKYGNVRYDESTPRYTFYFKRLEAKQKKEHIIVYAANAFNLTRSAEMTGIADQPDIVQALTEQAPLGATQSANRVNLYFKHQFAQVQVNLKSSSDNSVSIDANQIRKVELLGVSDTAFVFTELNKEGKVQPTTYKSVDISGYTDEQLARNPYGTSFELFDMGADNYTPGYLKSYNGITFGQLQAIRVTWTEEADGGGIEHVSTYHVADDHFRNLTSGTRYVWNIELRRGTLAIIRTDIIDWIVQDADGNQYEYDTNGTITN